jgi:hypothetical protein
MYVGPVVVAGAVVASVWPWLPASESKVAGSTLAVIAFQTPPHSTARTGSFILVGSTHLLPIDAPSRARLTKSAPVLSKN